MISSLKPGAMTAEPPESGVGVIQPWCLALVRHAPDFLALLDANGVIQHIDCGVKRVLGYEPNEMSGRVLTEFVDPDDVAGLAAALAALPAHSAHAMLAFGCRHKDGTSRRIEMLSHNFSGDPHFGGIAVGARDATNSGSLRQAHLLAGTRCGLQMEDASDAIYFADQDLRFLDANAAACRLFGYPRE